MRSFTPAALAALCAAAIGVALVGRSNAAVYHIKPGGSPAADLAAFQNVFDHLQAGDVVYVGGGDYSPGMHDGDNNLLIMDKNGAAGNWIIIKPEPGQHPVLHLSHAGGSSGFNLSNCSFIRVEGLELAGLPGGTGGALNAGDWQGDPASGPHVAHDIQFVGNIVHDFAAAGISANGSQDLIEGNTVFNCCHTGVAGYSGIDIYEPHVQSTDHTHFAAENGELGNPNNAYTLIIRNNTVYSCRMDVNETGFDRPVDGNGIILDDFNHTQQPGPGYTGRALIASNVVYNNGGAGIHGFHSSHLDLIGNTCWYNCRNVKAAELDVMESDTEDCYAYDNIALSDGGGQDPVGHQPTDVTAVRVGNGAKAWFDYNLYNTHDGGANSHDLVGKDPLFLRPGTDGSADFHLLPGSPAIGAGLNTWQVRWDHDGHSRLSVDDIGAYQASSPPLGQRVSLRGVNGLLASCDLSDGDRLKCAWAQAAGSWEQFDVSDAGGGQVALKSPVSQYYLSCDLNQAGAMRAAWAASVGSWERFQWVNVNGGFALLSLVNGKYVTCDLSRSGDLFADHATAITDWETFALVP